MDPKTFASPCWSGDACADPGLLGSSAGDLAVEAEAQRDRVRRAGPQRALAVHGQADPARIAHLHNNGIPVGPALRGTGNDVRLGPGGPAWAGALDRPILDGR